ncbi:T9SS type A sorting domain-containing protein, partial [bacterium]|nr:T9SS type A sorting domain-containing protein [bacterium]
DIHMFPWTPETSCPEPIIHIYPPGTTYVEWNPHPNSVPVSITISDGEGIFHILSGSIDTLYISFALPPGYSINPYGAKIVDAEYVNFSVYADVVNPDGADTIWLFTNEPAAYPITVEGIGKIQNNQLIPQKMRIAVHPNPFNSSCRIIVDAKNKGTVEIYSILGEKIIIYDIKPGHSEFIWKSDNLSSGIYFVRLKAGDRTITKRAILIR